MCDYYEFSYDLLEFLYKFNQKLRLKALYNIEIHGLHTIEINICTTEDSTYEYIKNMLITNEDELFKKIKHQLYILPSTKIIYNHVKNIPSFEEERDRDISIDYICKYFR